MPFDTGELTALMGKYLIKNLFLVNRLGVLKVNA